MTSPDVAARAAARRPGRLRVGVVGAGRVGAVLGAALRLAGHDIVAVSAVSDLSRRRASALLPGVPLDEPDRIAQLADLLLLAVPDDVLPDLVSGLAAAGALRPGAFVVHTSGRYGTQVLAPAVAEGCLPMALHPVMAFTGTSVDLDRLRGISFGVSAPHTLRAAAETLVLEMGGEPVWIEESARPLYHAALAHGANHLAVLVTSAVDLLRAAGVEGGERMLGPLLSAALDNALRYGDRALTGPVARGDAGTVAAHLAALRAADPHVAEAYLALSRLTADRALAAGILAPDDGERLLDVLADGRGAAAATDDHPRSAPGRRPLLVRTVGELDDVRAGLTGSVALVPTMGALHEGHRALLRTARQNADHVVVSVFVNPLQFGPTEDFDRYPRDLDADLAICAADEVDVVFAPDGVEMYPQPPQVRVSPGPLGERFEGAVRPGHFEGVLTVVAKLFHLVRPELAVFGRKDAQQLALIRRMVADLNLPVRILDVPTVREADGLAASSRNRYLSDADRARAAAFPQALNAAARLAAEGGSPSELIERARRDLSAAVDAIDYLALVDAATFEEIDDARWGRFRGEALLIGAVRVGGTRLIDNMAVATPRQLAPRRKMRRNR